MVHVTTTHTTTCTARKQPRSATDVPVNNKTATAWGQLYSSRSAHCTKLWLLCLHNVVPLTTASQHHSAPGAHTGSPASTPPVLLSLKMQQHHTACPKAAALPGPPLWQPSAAAAPTRLAWGCRCCCRGPLPPGLPRTACAAQAAP